MQIIVPNNVQLSILLDVTCASHIKMAPMPKDIMYRIGRILFKEKFSKKFLIFTHLH